MKQQSKASTQQQCCKEEETLMNNDCYFSSEKLRKQVLGEIRDTINKRHSSGLTRQTLAKEIGVTREQLTRLLLGDYSLKIEYLCYLIVRLGIQWPTAQ